MDRLRLRGVLVHAHHGLHRWERETGQPLEIDVELELDLRPAATEDRLEATVDYTELYRRVTEAVTSRCFALMEAVAEEVARSVLSFPAVLSATVRVRKPRAFLPGPAGEVEVEITRRRNDFPNFND